MDYKIFRAINMSARQNFVLDRLMIFMSKNIPFVFMVILGFMWFKDGRNRKVAILSIISVMIGLLVNVFIKQISFKKRPWKSHPIHLLYPSKADSSFPSKHVLLTFAVSTSILLHQRFLGWITTGLSMLTGLSRIWVGHHYPSDIFGSAVLGSVISIAMDKASNLLPFFRINEKRSIYFSR